MKKVISIFSFALLLSIANVFAQEAPTTKIPSEKNTDKFKQMYDLLATPNMYRTASGAPGPEYYQQQADYKIDIELDDKNTKLYGSETITYHNNAKESLDYLWVQLDQNQQSRTSKTPLSVYLSQHGIKVVNIPMIKDQPLPTELLEVDQRKIFALTIDPDSLSEIRKNRLQRLGADKHQGEYAEHNKIVEEIEWANNIFKENKRWPVFNVTDKALEETAADILKLLNMRRNNIFKQSKNDPA